MWMQTETQTPDPRLNHRIQSKCLTEPALYPDLYTTCEWEWSSVPTEAGEMNEQDRNQAVRAQ